VHFLECPQQLLIKKPPPCVLPDAVVSIDVSRQIVETNKSPNLEFLEIDGDGHNMESVTQTVHCASRQACVN
jgi:hypothetical protein